MHTDIHLVYFLIINFCSTFRSAGCRVLSSTNPVRPLSDRYVPNHLMQETVGMSTNDEVQIDLCLCLSPSLNLSFLTYFLTYRFSAGYK